MKKTLILILFVLALVQINSLAQKYTVNANLDSTVMWIGNQAHLTFEISQQPNLKVVLPIFSDSIISGIELVERVKTDTTKTENGSLVVNQKCVITSFKDSLYYIPSFPFVLNGDTVWSKSLTIKVVQPFKIDTASNTIADIKNVFDPKFNWIEFLKTLLLILLVAAILIVLFVYVRKYWMKKPLFEKKKEIVLPAHIIALNKLDAVKQEKAWQNGRYKEFHTELTDIIREYMESVFEINCMEMTSEEILSHLRILKQKDNASFMNLQQILHVADLVKFAKFNPLPDEHELSLKNAYLFINQTKIETEVPLEDVQNK